jgi:hypothetical protein
LNVLSDTALVAGAWPIPIQGPHAASSILAPAATISARAPFAASMLRTCFEPGAITRLTPGLTLLPLRMRATFIISTYDELVQLPIQTWSTLIFPISLAFFTLSGLCGIAASGSSFSSPIVISFSYTASVSGLSSTQSISLPCARRKSLVISSLGNMEVVAPSSAPIFVIVALSGTVRFSIPSPAYSIILPTPPFTLIILSTSSIISFADTHGFNLPVKTTFTTEGIMR